MNEEARRFFPTTAAFLEEAQRLLREERFLWSRCHAQGHDVSLVEALRVVLTAKPDRIAADPIPGRYRVWGFDQYGRWVRVVLEILPLRGGDVVRFITAFDEHKEWGS